MKAQQRRARLLAAASRPRWFFGQGALEESVEALLGLPQPMLLCGEGALLRPLRRRLIEALLQSGIELKIFEFPGGAECSRDSADLVSAEALGAGSKSLIGLGGGKCLDAVKWAGNLSGLPVATIPTSPATCACATGIVVEHSDSGEQLDIHDLDSEPAVCIADFEILATAPDRLLRAGIADTRAKWLEWEAVEAPEGPGSDAARKAFETVGRASASREELWDACLRLSAEASNQGGAPAAAAHSFAAGISVLPCSKVWLHGEWVFLGLEFQRRLEGKEAPQGRLPFALDGAEFDKVAGRILAPEESIHLMKGAPFSLDAVKAVLRELQP